MEPRTISGGIRFSAAAAADHDDDDRGRSTDNAKGSADKPFVKLNKYLI
jgi:hypothetical protein